jgi:hypothetical protein
MGRIEQRFVLEIKSFGLKNEWLIYAVFVYSIVLANGSKSRCSFGLKLQVGFLFILFIMPLHI